jgi:hypothetical protein
MLAIQSPEHLQYTSLTFTIYFQNATKEQRDWHPTPLKLTWGNMVKLYSDLSIRASNIPILSKAGILMSYVTDKLSIPASLRGAMYGLACAYWSQDPSLKDLPAPRQDKLFEHTHAALNRDLHFPKLSTLQACLLVLREQPDGSLTTEIPRIWVYACQAMACAQSLGHHQDPTLWKLPT